MDKKLCVVRVKNGATVMIGGYRNGMLLVREWKSIKGTIAAVSAGVAEFIAEYKRKGFIVAVDDAYGQLAIATIRCSLSDTDTAGQPRLVQALNAYRHLAQHRAISFGDKNRIDVNETVTEPIIDGNGKTTYMIDWEAFKEEQLTLLLLAYHALTHQPLEVNYLQQYFGHLNHIKVNGSTTSVRGFRS